MSCKILNEPLFPQTKWTEKSLTEAASMLLNKSLDNQKCRLMYFGISRLGGTSLPLSGTQVAILIAVYGRGYTLTDSMGVDLETNNFSDIVVSGLTESSGAFSAMVTYAIYTWD